MVGILKVENEAAAALLLMEATTWGWKMKDERNFYMNVWSDHVPEVIVDLEATYSGEFLMIWTHQFDTEKTSLAEYHLAWEMENLLGKAKELKIKAEPLGYATIKNSVPLDELGEALKEMLPLLH